MIGQKGLPAIWGGVERHVEELATRLAKENNEVTVYGRRWYSNWKRPKFQGVSLRFVPSIRTKNLDAISHAFFATIDALRRDFDIIHYHGVGPALLSWMPRLFKPSVKVVATIHCLDRRHGKWGVLARLMLWLGEWAACYFPHETLAVSQTLKDYVKNKYHREAIYLPNGVEIVETTGNQTLKKFGLEENQYLLAVSRLIPHKALHYLIEAFRGLKKNRPDLGAGLKLVIVGDGSCTDGYVRFLREMAYDLPEVIFTGWQNGRPLQELQANCLLFVHPSQSEGLPLVALEAMSYGKAVVASDIPEHQELIADKRFLFAHNRVADLKKKLIWALENPEIRRVAGLQNRRLVEKDYNWEENAATLEFIYQKLLAKEDEKYRLAVVNTSDDRPTISARPSPSASMTATLTPFFPLAEAPRNLPAKRPA